MTALAHFFIGISLPEEKAKSIYEQTLSLREKNSFKSWVHPLDYHLTLAFLGRPQSESQLKQVKNNLTEALKKHDAFHLKTNTFQTFGRENAPRIFWLGVEESESLTKLRDQTYQICEDIGFELDQRPFAPHITIAKKWVSHEEFLDADFESPETMNFEVTSVDLFQTKLNELPRYHSIHNVMLRSD
ncbi:RNA 2',3'-cyclic phosphodiesterase [Bacillus sp. UMB0893]|uniref:RNA 2',3'-cyclic phosphodiesterase n=1 Tax=Bacillus sp. UMB0893 TaxID=2066053 RepID=UPI000C76A92F|nr:RNA 2',3'-cyclic phosphodiesterase [Bacillus sp. UMB0893]PLR68541.1 RNA 2',3'-cyclic phosphodiesterase [Bacillus sp. UMB0893]